MLFAWGVLAPLAVLTARYFKIWPGQNWPKDLDSPIWWRLHWMTQTVVVCLSAVALYLILSATTNSHNALVHRMLGYSLLALAFMQAVGGLMRGSKGGPTAPAKDGSLRGDHYDMTPWRKAFEALHKSLGYLALLMASLAICSGLWAANAPVWMFMVFSAWVIVLVFCFVILQKRGMAIDTYQAIWGPDPKHPGNRQAIHGWGMQRPVAAPETDEEKTDFRRD